MKPALTWYPITPDEFSVADQYANALQGMILSVKGNDTTDNAHLALIRAAELAGELDLPNVADYLTECLDYVKDQPSDEASLRATGYFNYIIECAQGIHPPSPDVWPARYASIAEARNAWQTMTKTVAGWPDPPTPIDTYLDELHQVLSDSISADCHPDDAAALCAIINHISVLSDRYGQPHPSPGKQMINSSVLEAALINIVQELQDLDDD